MAIDDMHEVTFLWPDSSANEVVVTGTFDDWSRSVQLTKTPAGFRGTVQVPWNSRTLYKFIVDGRWMTAPSQSQETDSAGNVNSVYESPPKPDSPTAKNPVDEVVEDIPEVAPELQPCLSTESISPKDTTLNDNIATIPPVTKPDSATIEDSADVVVEDIPEVVPEEQTSESILPQDTISNDHISTEPPVTQPDPPIIEESMDEVGEDIPEVVPKVQTCLPTESILPEDIISNGHISTAPPVTKPDPSIIEESVDEVREDIPEVVPEIEACLPTEFILPKDTISNGHISPVPPVTEPDPPTIEESVVEVVEDIPEVVPEVQARLPAEFKDTSSNGHILTVPPVVTLEENTDANAENLEPGLSQSTASHLNGSASVAVGTEEKLDHAQEKISAASDSVPQTIDSESTAQQDMVDTSTEAKPPIEDFPLLTAGVSVEPNVSAEVEEADVKPQNDSLPVASLGIEFVAPTENESLAPFEATSTGPATDIAVEKPAQETASAEVVPGGVESKTREMIDEPDPVLPESDRSAETVPAVVDSSNGEVIGESLEGREITTPRAPVGTSIDDVQVAGTKTLNVESHPDHVANSTKDLTTITTTDDPAPVNETKTESVQPATAPALQLSLGTEAFELPDFSSTASQIDEDSSRLTHDGVDTESVTPPPMPGAFDFTKPTTVQKEKSSQVQAVPGDSSSTPIKNPAPRATPAEPLKAEKFPSYESKDTSTSLQPKSHRKKRLSLFGKIKHFLLPDKDDKEHHS